MWFSFPIRPLLHSDDGWSGCFSLLCHSRPWGTSSPQRQRLVPGLQLRWPLIHPQWCLNGVGSVVGRRHIYSSGVSDELWGSVLWGGILEEWHGERLCGVRAVRDRPEGCGSASGAAGDSSAIAVARSSHQDALSKHEEDYSCLIKQ